jgi:multiple sugar transport system substrate-binding protein
MKKCHWLTTLMICVFVLALAGCVAPAAPAPVPAAPAAAQAPEATQAPAPAAATACTEPVTLSYWRAGGAGTAEVSDKAKTVIQKFEAANPNIKIKAELIPFPEYDQKSLTSLQAKEGPDILEINSVSLGMFTSKGLVNEIDDLVAGSKSVKKDQFYEGGWNTGIYNGKLWGLPLDTGTRIVLYNKDLFKEAGVKEFGNTVTWPELLDAAGKITNKDKGVYGWGYAFGERWVALYEGLGHFAIQNGAEFISPDMSKVTVNSPAMLETLKFYKELSKFAPPDAVNWNAQQQDEQMFMDGKLGMYVAGFWSLDGVLKSKPDINYGLAEPMGKVAGSSTGGWLISMPAYVEGCKREAAWKFMEFIFQPENNAAWTDLMPNQPASVSLTLQDKRYDQYKEVLPNSRHPIPLHPRLPDMADALQVEVQKYLLDQQSAEDTLAALQTKFEGMLK